MAVLGCQSLPKTPHQQKSIELTATAHIHQKNPKPTPILGKQNLDNDTLSGYHLMLKGADAFEIRRRLSSLATQSIDIQYYIWHDDEAGQIILKDLWMAANRGVVVRLLLDDLNVSTSLEQKLLMLASHPNVAVRLMNPNAYRNIRPIGYISSPYRSNRRMHNKAMIFDNQVSVIGGRNIGNEYLNTLNYSQFADLDILLTGKVNKQVGASFEHYWNSVLAFDVQTLVRPTQTTSVQIHLAKIGQISPFQGQTFADVSEYKQIELKYAPMTFVSDDVGKIHGDKKSVHLVDVLQDKFGTPKATLSIISSYFVPTKAGMDQLLSLAKKGVRINILTNAYDATDVGVVHAGYAHWRKDLLRAGVHLYELKASDRHVAGSAKDNRIWRAYGKTNSSLHAKAFAVDNHQVFIGSYNIDPRSAKFNTEMGVIIDDELLAQQFHDVFNENLLTQAYELKLDGNQLQWHTIEHGQKYIYTQEPNMQQSDKMVIFLLSLLPIDWLL